MCNHLWRITNDVRVCMRCGLTVNRHDGQIMAFDRKLPDIVSATKKKGRKRNGK